MGRRYMGSCSWKYPSWEGLVYSKTKGIDYLAEYADRYDTVEVDQWFWSLFGEKVRLPAHRDVLAYDGATPDGFRFTVKLPNALSLTHHYAKVKGAPLTANAHLLSPELLSAFLACVEPLIPKVGLFILQFEYLNKRKMGGLDQLMERLVPFLQRWPAHLPLGIELRNPRWLGSPWFQFMAEHTVSPVLLEGYYMDPVVDTLRAQHKMIDGPVCVRLHGPDREKMDKVTGKKWGAVVRPMDDLIAELVPAFAWLSGLDADLYINVNNHFEGCAPLTIEKIAAALSDWDGESTMDM